MSFVNSTNWRDEAELRNQRKAKADSMSALLDHVDWNPDTLTISLSGITLSWDDIEGADDVLKKDKDGEGYITQITKDTIATTHIIADSVAADNITNATLWGRTFGFDFSITNGFSVGYVGDVGDYKAKLRVGKDEDGYGQVFVESQSISLDANKRIDLWATSGVYINGDAPLTSGTLPYYLTDYVTYTGNSKFGSMSDSVTWYVMAVANGELHYVTKAQLKSYLGI